MIPLRGLAARYTGRERVGPATMGQVNMVRCVRVDPPEHMNYEVVRNLPQGTTYQGVADAVGLLMSRHESLRTTFHDGIQRVAGDGELTVEVHPAGDGVIGRVAADLRGRRFDVAAELPLRVAVIAGDDGPEQVVLVTTHSTVDAVGLALLAADWEELVRGRTLGPTALQPVDVATMEGSSAGLRRADAALRYWRTQLGRIPRSTLTVTVDDRDHDWSLPRLRVRSAAVAAALARITARTGISRSGALLAAFGTLAGLRAGQPVCPIISISANRFRPELREYVGPLAQDALIPIDLTGPAFDAVLRATRAASLAAYQNSRFDSAALVRIMEEVSADRGVFFARDLVFNDMSAAAPAGPPLRGAPAERALGEEPDIRSAWLPDETLPTRVSLWVNRLEGEADVTLWADPRCLPGADTLLLGEGVMRLLAEAGRRDVPLADLPGITGITPLPRDGEWLVADSCWVDLAEVRRLVADAVPGPSSVSAVPDERLGHRLVCHLAAPVTPEEAHAACLALLPGRMAAIAPHHYVVAGVTEGTGRPAPAEVPVPG
ncbi:condensation domain-containing protein [Microbispora sp. CA-102843]|uniref:condensation domain-containing protein n=1 Tax=Microbispora sp. CA-102843 TaxID=3239952 RepID=UPI003D910D26